MADQNPTPLPVKPDAPEPHFLLERSSAWQEFKDLIFPKPEPELNLESKPIPVKNIWSEPKSLSSRLSSIAVHFAVLGIMLLPFWRPVRTQIQKVVDIPIFVPAVPVHTPTPKMKRLAGGGSPVVRHVPRVQVPVIRPTPLPAATLVPKNLISELPSFGAIGAVGGPPGSGNGANGNGGGSGSGTGGGNCIGTDCGDGGAVTGPVVLVQSDPEFTDAARKAKFEGTCILFVIIGTDGRVHDAKVVQPLGLGLDENAIKSVMTWRFSPARDKNGKPVKATANIEVNFTLH